MRVSLRFCLFIFLSLITWHIYAQNNPDLAEKLGYDNNAKLLIIHADDLGVAHSQNRASIDAYEKGGVNSASIMVPCPWFPEIAKYAREHPDFDLGLHLTLTSEWNYYKWGGVSSSDDIASLLNDEGYFYATTEEVAKNARPEEVELEIRAQIEKALAAGIKPTHLDSHMGSMFATPELFKIYLKVGAEYDIPVFIPINYANANPDFAPLIKEVEYPVDNLTMAPTETSPDKWNDFYLQAISNMKPGLNEIIVHLAHDDNEMLAVTAGHEYFDAKWRQRDYEFVTSDAFKKALDKNNIKLVTWKEIKNLE